MQRVKRQSGSEPWSLGHVAVHSQLGGLGHDVTVHEERRLALSEVLGLEVLETVGDEGLVEVDTVAHKVVAAVAGNLGTWVRKRAPRACQWNGLLLTHDYA